MARVYFGLGTNLGNKEANIRCAVEEIEKRIGKVISLSAFYETAPWGFSSENSFLNAAVSVDTSLNPLQVMLVSQGIEKEMGRICKSVDGNYSDRTIDIDILLYGDSVIETKELVIPHPLMTERNFVMMPLLDIASEVVHPVLRTKLKDIPFPGLTDTD